MQNICARYRLSGRSEKRRRHGRPYKTSARESRRLKTLSRLGRLKITSELSFEWNTFFVRNCHKQLLDDDSIHAVDIFILVTRHKLIMVHNKNERITSSGPIEFSTWPLMAIGPLWCSLMSVSLFYTLTLMMKVKDVGEIIDRIWIQTQCDFGYVETFPLWFGDASSSLHWQSDSGWWKCQLVSILTLTSWVYRCKSCQNIWSCIKDQTYHVQK